MRILHIHSSFAASGMALLTASFINAFGKAAAHYIVSAEAEGYGAAGAINPGIAVSYPQRFPPLVGMPTLGRLQRLAKAMRGHDLILTYGWGAMDAVMAHTLFGEFHGLSPLVHHEDAFDISDALSPKRTRVWYRRIAFARTSSVIVPLPRLEVIARESWQLPAGKVRRIPIGVDIAASRRKPKPDALPRVIKHADERWMGTLDTFTSKQDLPRLLRVLARLSDEWQLVIVGKVPDYEAIRDEALRLEVMHRVHLPGHVGDLAKVMGLFDLFVLASDCGECPAAAVQAMAAGLAIAGANVGGVADLVAEENRPFIVAGDDEAELASVLFALTEGEILNRRVGEANRRRAKSEFDAKKALAGYRAVYAQALQRQSFP